MDATAITIVAAVALAFLVVLARRQAAEDRYRRGVRLALRRGE